MANIYHFTPEMLMTCDVIHDRIMIEYSRVNHTDDFREELDNEANTASNEFMERFLCQIGLQTSLEIYKDSGYDNGTPNIRQLYYVVLEYVYHEVAKYRGWEELEQ